MLLSSCDPSAEQTGQDPATQSAEADPFVLSQRLVNKDGAFRLLTVIDGVEPNERFVSNLRLVQAQRAVIGKLEQEAAKSEETEQKLGEIRAKLENNTKLMAEIYGYDAKADYAFFALRSAIVRDDGGKKVLVKNIDSPKRHQELHLLLGKHGALVAQEGEGSEQAKAVAAELLEDFGFDLNAGHKLEVARGALYLKVAQ